MDIEHSIGTIRCDGCDAKYDARISRLSDPIDVYAEWIDQCALAFISEYARLECAFSQSSMDHSR